MQVMAFGALGLMLLAPGASAVAQERGADERSVRDAVRHMPRDARRAMPRRFRRS